MRIAILSDIHDNLWKLAAALEGVRDAGALLCCGDLCSPFVMDVLARFPREVHIVFGNNDADLFRITRKSTDRVRVHGEFFEAEFGGRRFAMNHFDYLARPIAESGRYDVVCYGHNHKLAIERTGKTLLVNPGPVMGAAFYSGEWRDVPATFVLYDTATDSAEAFEVDHPLVKPYQPV
jgi:putative phosphoesterase